MPPSINNSTKECTMYLYWGFSCVTRWQSIYCRKLPTLNSPPTPLIPEIQSSSTSISIETCLSCCLLYWRWIFFICIIIQSIILTSVVIFITSCWSTPGGSTRFISPSFPWLLDPPLVDFYSHSYPNMKHLLSLLFQFPHFDHIYTVSLKKVFAANALYQF